MVPSPAAYAAALIVILLVGSWPVDKLGRKPALWAVQVFMIIAAIIEIFATNWKHWLAAKILNVRMAAKAYTIPTLYTQMLKTRPRRVSPLA